MAAAVATCRSPIALPTPPESIEDITKYQSSDEPDYYAENEKVRLAHARKPRSKRKPEGLLSALCALLVRHQIGFSINLIFLLCLTHILFPRARPTTSKFFTLSYYDSTTGQYTQGWDDICLVTLWVAIFTFLRAATMDYVLKPFAKLNGIKKNKTIIRFAEQAWLLIYCTNSSAIGLYIYKNSPYYLNLRGMWADFPTMTMAPTMKWYYLLQFAFWLQQIMVINIEERRKDHWQMFTHHIITNFLVFMSYAYYQTKVGATILVLMDFVDIFLALAKVLNYFNYRTLCDTTFGLFIVTWFLLRHVCYNLICWSLYTDLPGAMPYGCYDSVTGKQLTTDGGDRTWRHVFQSFFNPGGEVCFNPKIRTSFLALLVGLQVITIAWFFMICRVAYRVLSGSSAEDTRSDDESDGIEEEDEESTETRVLQQAASYAHGAPIEEEVGVEEINFARRNSARIQSRRKTSGRTTGINIPGLSEPKEILNRIGCDTKTT